MAQDRDLTSARLLFRVTVAAPVLLAVLLALFILWPQARTLLLPIPSFVVMTHGFILLAAFCTGFLAAGRYRVLRDPFSYWTGMGFLSYSIFTVFYLLWWPGLTESGGSLVPISPGAAAWNYVLSHLLLGILLSAGALSCRPWLSIVRSSRWLLVGAIGVVTALNLLLGAVMHHLPPLHTSAGFTAFGMGATWTVALVLIAGAVVCVRCYRRHGDWLVAHVALSLQILACADIIGVLGGQRYSLPWYVARGGLIASCLIVLFAMLWDYVMLFRREQKARQELAAVNESLQAAQQDAERRAEQLHTVLEAMPDPVVIYDREGNVVIDNPAARSFVKRTSQAKDAAEIHATHHFRHPDGTPMAPEELAGPRALRGEAVVVDHMIVRDLEGGDHHVLSSAAPIFVGDELTGAVVAWRDITGLQRTTAELRQAQARLQVLFGPGVGDIGIGIVLADEAGDILESNDYYLHLLGYTREDLTSGTARWLELTPPEWRWADERALAQLHARGVCDPFEKEYLRPDGTRVPVLIVDAIMPGTGSEILSFVLDMTARKQAEEALRESEHRYRSLFERMLEGYALHEVVRDAEGRVVDFRYLAVNPAFAPLTGYADVVGKTIGEAIPGVWEAEPELFERYARAGESGEIQSWDFHFSPNDRWYALSAYQTEPDRFAVIFDDITARRQAEAALRESEARLRLATSGAGLGVFDWEIPTDTPHWDERMYEIFGRDPRRGPVNAAEFFASFVVPEDAAEFERLLMETMHRGGVFDVAVRIRREDDGAWCWIEYFAQFQLAPDGSPLRLVGVIADISERKQAEAERERLLAEVQEANEELAATNEELAATNEELIEAQKEREDLLAQVQAERERLFSVLSMFPAYVCLLRPDYTCAFANRRFTELFGEGRPDQKCYHLLFGRNEPCDNCQSYDCLQDGRPKVWEWEGPGGNYFEVYDYPFTDIDGTKLVLEVGFEITERRAAAEELQRHRDHLEELVAARTEEVEERSRVFESVFNNSLSSLVLLDPEFNFLRVNESYAQSCGRPVDDFRGHNHFEDYPSDEVQAAFEAVVHTRQPWSIAARPFEFPDHPDWGTTYWDLSLVPILDAAGEVEMLLFSLQDVTERTRARQQLEARTAELAESERKYRELVENANSAIIRWQADGTMIFANEHAEQLFGYERGELLGQDVGVLLPPVDSSGRSLAGLIHDISSHPEQYRVNENENVTRDGRRLWLSWTNHLFRDAGGNIESIMAVGTDRTALHEAERQLELHRERVRALAAELALAEQRERNRIATGLHDDISQTLAFAKLKLGALRKAVAAPEQQADAETEVRQLGQIIDETIGHTRHLIYELSTPILFQKGLAEAIIWTGARAHEQHGLPVQVQVTGEVVRLPEDVEITVLQAVKELLNNAVKYAQASTVTVGVEYGIEVLRVQVADDGVGFDPEAVQVHARGGFGLLNIRERLTYIGGALEIESAPGRGTRCTISVPVREA